MLSSNGAVVDGSLSLVPEERFRDNEFQGGPVREGDVELISEDVDDTNDADDAVTELPGPAAWWANSKAP